MQMFVSVDAILSFKHTVEIALAFWCFCANRLATHLPAYSLMLYLT